MLDLVLGGMLPVSAAKLIPAPLHIETPGIKKFEVGRDARYVPGIGFMRGVRQSHLLLRFTLFLTVG